VTKKDHKLPVPTGNPWLPSRDDPATVPVPLPVIIVKIEGPYTERDRKLWTFLLHAVWDELGEKPIHELPVAKVNQIFRELGGDHNTRWIWESAIRLTRTIVEWERTEGDERYEGVASLFQAEVSKQSRSTGMLRFAFPALLIPILKDPKRFARLRVHFLIGLSGKYAVTLYELLESVANKLEPVLDVPIDALRLWLKVPEGKLTRYQDFRRFVLEPSIEQINAKRLGAGFTVDMQPMKKGRAVHRVRFHIKKVDERRVIEEAMQGNKPPQAVGKKAITSNHLSETLPNQVRLMPSDFERAKAVAPGWDVYFLEQEWLEWIAKKGNPDKPGPAFIAFCRKKYQREGRP
jgi:replication initiator protein